MPPDASADFWLGLWERNQINFHRSEVNALLVRHFAALSLAKRSRVFVPLCGKTNDIGWLLAQGHRVVGVELSELAVGQLFAALAVQPDVSPAGPLRRYSGPGVEIFVGDVFDLTADLLGPVDAIYDRAALIALPPKVRQRYAGHLSAITGRAPQLVIGYEYDPGTREGPPFSVDGAEVARLYGGSYGVTLLEQVPLDPRPDGTARATDTVWLLR